MSISVRCSDCGVRSQYPDRLAGQIVPCRACGSDVEVEAAASGRGRSSKGGGKKSKTAASAGAGGLVLAASLGGVLLVGSVVAGVVIVMAARRPAAGPAGQLAAADAGHNNGNNAAPAPAAAVNHAAPATGFQNAGGNAGNLGEVAQADGTNRPVATPVGKTAPAAARSVTPNNNAGGLRPATTAGTRLTITQPTPWQVPVDPPTTPTEFASQKPIKLKLDRNHLRDPAVVYPVTPGNVVGIRLGIGTRNPLELFDLTTGRSLGQVPVPGFTGSIGLSHDGKYVAMANSGGSTITVHDTKTKKPLGELTAGTNQSPFRVASLAFPRDDRLVAVSQLERAVKVWELPSGNPICEIRGNDKFAPFPMHVYSPGGNYIAVNADFLAKRIEIYSLQTGERVGSLEIEGNATSLDLAGMAFSSDGKEFAALYDVTSRGGRQNFSQFVVWNVETGKIASDFDIEPKLKEQLSPAYQKERLEPFPGSRRWLAHGTGIIDCDREQLIYSFPKLERVDLKVARRVMGPDWLVGVVVDNPDARLESISLNAQELAAAAEIASSGGLSIDTGLPPLTPADHREAALLPLSQEWSLTADPGPVAAAPKEMVALNAGGGVVRDFVVNRSSEPRWTVRVAEGENLSDPKIRVYESMPEPMRRTLRARPPQVTARKSTIESFDAATGASAGRFELPFSGSLLSVSSNGKLALVELHQGEGRLDLIDMTTGQPVMAWRPYRNVQDSRHRELFSAEFIDDDHVATLNKGDELVVWKLNPLTPVYRVEKIRQVVVTPGQAWLLVVRDELGKSPSLCGLQATTGESAGSIELSGQVCAVACHPQGELVAVSHGSDANQQVSVISLSQGSVVDQFPVPGLGQHLQWLSDDYLLMNGSQLLSRPLQAMVWKYDVDKAVFPSASPSLHGQWAAAQGNRWQVRSAVLPQPGVVSQLDAGKLESMAIVKPGTKVSLRLNIGNEPELAGVREHGEADVKAQLTKARQTVESPGNAVDVVIDVRLKPGETVELSKIGNRSETQSVVRKTIEFEVTYRQGTRVIWKTERRVGNLDRLLIRVRPDEPAQEAADRAMTDAAKRFLSTIELPSHILSDAAKDGLGHSALTVAK